MFENLLYQKAVTQRLESDLIRNSLPPSILCSGPPLSGKLSASLELARGLSCLEKRDWDCQCSSCRQHRLLTHSRMVLVGYRDMMPEILASAEVLRRDFRSVSHCLFIRSVRKLLRRFDSFLWEGEEVKLKRLRPLMGSLAESLDTLTPSGKLPERSSLNDRLEGIIEACGEMQKVLPGVLPVAQVRRLEVWASLSASGEHKTIIIDGADRMQESSCNALLKFLEEPPPDTTIILISKRKSLILPTVLSRLRDYSFRRRRPVEEEEVLRRVFREEGGRWKGLMEYFQAWRMGPVERLRELAVHFLEEARAKSAHMPSHSEFLTNSQDLKAFLEILSQELRRRWLNTPRPDYRRAVFEAELLRETHIRAENLNLTVPLLLQGLYAALGEQE